MKSRPKLSFEQANAICRELIPLGDRVFSYMAQLREMGFEAFVPRHEFIESFAATPEELEAHRRCVIEVAKERLGRPSPIRIHEDDMKHLYISPFLQQLREKRDRMNGVPVGQLSNRYPGRQSYWRREFDPCQRRLKQAEADQKQSYEARWGAMLTQERRILHQEAEQYRTGAGSRLHTFDRPSRYHAYSATMEQDTASLGFRYEPKSRPNYPIFSKMVSGEWDLCWSIDDQKLFYFSPFKGLLIPSLQLRCRTLRGTLMKPELGEFLVISYAAIIPGFGNGYGEFCDLYELERATRAHLRLYSLMAPIIEGGLHKVLLT